MMKKRFIIGLAIVISFPLLYGFTTKYFEDSNEDFTLGLQQKVTGEELFQKNCAACHGPDRQGNPPTFPSLISVSERLSKEQVKELLQTGRNLMPSFAHLSDQEREALAGYLFGENTFVKTQTEITPEQNGQRLFVANCARCHKATPDDPQPPDQKEWGMQPATLGGITARHSLNEFENILNTGPCYMPSFETLSDADKEDIYVWLKTMEGVFDDNMASRGMGCRMRCRN